MIFIHLHTYRMAHKIKIDANYFYVSVKVTLGTISLLVTDQRPMCDGWTGQIV